MSKSRPATVLVVDDEKPICELLADALAARDVTVETASSGRDALEAARRRRPDLLITDIRLGDADGLDVLDRLRAGTGEIPAVIITAYGDAPTLTAASRKRPVELMTKPLDLARLQEVVCRELADQRRRRRLTERLRRLRRLARRCNIQRKASEERAEALGARLAAHRGAHHRTVLQRVLIDYQSHIIASRTDDEVFERLFRVFVGLSGPVFGAALVCDEQATLRMVGRFGVPHPDGVRFCEELTKPLIDRLLVEAGCVLLDAGREAKSFHPSIRRYLVGVTILAIPLIPAEGEMIGLVMLYRKGEQPFTDEDLMLAEMIAPATAAAVRRND